MKFVSISYGVYEDKEIRVMSFDDIPGRNFESEWNKIYFAVLKGGNNYVYDPARDVVRIMIEAGWNLQDLKCIEVEGVGLTAETILKNT